MNADYWFRMTTKEMRVEKKKLCKPLEAPNLNVDGRNRRYSAEGRKILSDVEMQTNLQFEAKRFKNVLNGRYCSPRRLGFPNLFQK